MYNFPGFDLNGMETVLGGMLIIYMLLLAGSLVWAVVNYILIGIGTYTMASRRGIKHAWLAWLPIGNVWIMGAISDQYQYVSRGKQTIRGVILVILTLTAVALSGIATAFSVGGIIAQTAGDTNAMATAALNGGIVGLLTAIVTIFGSILQYFCMYDLYASSKPESAVLYLVLSLLVSVTTPFLIYFCRHHDLGMHSRRTVYRPHMNG